MWYKQQCLMNLGTPFEIINTKLSNTLTIFVNSKHYIFSVNLVIYASKRDYLNLKQWLEERINKVDDEFIESILNYIKKNLFSKCSRNPTINDLGKAQLTSESLEILLWNVIKCFNANNLSQKKNIFKRYIKIFLIYMKNYNYNLIILKK